MKLELEISDDLWKRIEHRASLFNVPTDIFFQRLLEQHAPGLPDPDAARALIDEIIASATPEDEDDYAEFMSDLERSRGDACGWKATEMNGAAR